MPCPRSRCRILLSCPTISLMWLASDIWRPNIMEYWVPQPKGIRLFLATHPSWFWILRSLFDHSVSEASGFPSPPTSTSKPLVFEISATNLPRLITNSLKPIYLRSSINDCFSPLGFLLQASFLPHGHSNISSFSFNLSDLLPQGTKMTSPRTVPCGNTLLNRIWTPQLR